jgi:hypothetical protein
MYVDIISFSQALSLSMYVCIYVYVTMNGKGVILHHVGTKFHMYVCMYCRSFDDGLSECGLECPMGVLALDSKLDPFYSKQGMRKTAPVNTYFPCG